jgi:hypothetical protein
MLQSNNGLTEALSCHASIVQTSERQEEHGRPQPRTYSETVVNQL